MYREETALVIIPCEFRIYFRGVKELEMYVYEIEDSLGTTGEIGMVKMQDASGRTFAVRRNDENSKVKNQWRIVQ